MRALGIDLGGTKIAGVLLDDAGTVCEEVWREHDAQGTAAVVSLITRTASDLWRGRAQREKPPIGVSIAAWLDRDRTQIWPTPNLGMPKAPLKQLLSAAVGCPVTLENDGNATAVAEAIWGAGRNAQLMILLTLGTGVGGGVTDRGRLVGGARGFAGELGHVSVDPEGPRCVCGARGCLELYASGSALASRARERLDKAALVLDLAAGRAERITARHVVQAARAGDPLAVRLVEDAGRAIGRAVAVVAAVVDPDLVVLAGSVAGAAEDLIAGAAREELAKRQPLRSFLQPVPIVLAEAGRTAAARGAAELARRSSATVA